MLTLSFFFQTPLSNDDTAVKSTLEESRRVDSGMDEGSNSSQELGIMMDDLQVLPPFQQYFSYRKNSKIWDTSNNCHNCPKNRKSLM